jgi:hypothetical protein
MSEPVTETRAVGGFDRISLRAEYQNDLIINQGDQESLTITAPADILSRIEADVEDGRLKIRTAGSWTQKVSDAVSTTFSRPHVRYEVTVRDLRRLEIRSVSSAKIPKMTTQRLEVELKGAGQIVIDDLSVESLEARLDGAGRIDIEGTARKASVTLSGSGEYRAPNLRCEKLEIELTGVGRAVVWAVEELEVEMQGIGSIQYYGSPRVKQDVTAIGSVSHAGDK